MRFDDRLLDEIKARIPPSRLIGRSVNLQRAGTSYKALSPFNKEKTPSFYVSDEKMLFKDFSSGLGGDVFKWVMLTEGLSFPEAVEKLAAEAGVALPERDPETAAREQVRRGLIDWLEAANAFFADSLRASVGKEARDYLARRGVPAQDWSRFEIGYAPPGWESLRTHLQKKGASPQDLLAAGLVRESDRGQPPYDAFRNRVTFAIRDPAGRLVGFGARALAKDEKAKYINSPESEVFKKGDLLYRFPEARKAANASGRDPGGRGLVIVEGYMDAIAMAQAGVGETVASLGTALTPEQIELAWRAGPKSTLLLDGDAAGIAAGYRAAERVLTKLEPGRTMRFARLKGVKDPDDLVRAEGLDGVRRVLDAAENLDAVVWEKLVRDHPVSTPDDAAALEEATKGEIARIAHAGVRAHYRAALFDRFSEAFGFKARQRAKKTARQTFGRPGDGSFDDSRRETKSRPYGPGGAAELRDPGRLLHALLARPEVIERVAEPLATAEIRDESLAALRDALVAAAEETADVDKIKLERHLAVLGVEQIAAKVREEPTFSGAPIFGSRMEESEAAEAWLREVSRYHWRLHEREERVDLQGAMLAGVDAGDREAQRRFAAASPPPMMRHRGPREGVGEEIAGDLPADVGEGLNAALRALDAAHEHKRRKRKP
jgi:DNA primase